MCTSTIPIILDCEDIIKSFYQSIMLIKNYLYLLFHKFFS